MRKLTEIEKKRLAALTSNAVSVALIEPTATGLKKSIMDATFSVRHYLAEERLHNYESQKKGQGHKSIIKTFFLNENTIIPSQASLYRPVTKKGDPRIWFKGLPHYASAGDILALMVMDDDLYVLNLTKINILNVLEIKKSGPIWDVVAEISGQEMGVAFELLGKLKKISQAGPARSIMKGSADTAIGRTLEALLGLKMNSNKAPDYKGIELKSYRSKKGNRKTLFAQVPNWELSKFKSSEEIYNNFSYIRDGERKLNCTVSAKVRNSQGLMLKVDQKIDRLLENSDKTGIGDFAVWLMENLRRRLLEKHAETFWIAADSIHKGGSEYFQFTKVLHTRRPILSQFDILLEQGVITLDHLIELNKKGGHMRKGRYLKFGDLL